MRNAYLFIVCMTMSLCASCMSLPTKAPYPLPTYYSGGFSPLPDYGSGGFEPPFSVPGRIIDGITITKLLNLAGGLWNANTVIDGARLTCQRWFADRDVFWEDGAEFITIICDYLDNESIQNCGQLWDTLLVPGIGNGSHSFIPDLRCRERDYDYYVYPDYPFPTPPSDWNFTDFVIEKRILEGVNPLDSNPYDPCSENGIQKVNNILFALLDWLGPSIFDVFLYSGEPYSICGLMRYLLSMDLDDLYENIIGILKFPLADLLETIQPLDVCAILSELELEPEAAEAIGVLKDLLVELSGLSESQLCTFLAEEQSRDAYLQAAETMMTSLFFVIHNEETCNNVLAIIAPQDRDGYFHLVTGFNISLESERNEFCALAVEAYSPSSTYVPTPYQLPPGVAIEDVTPFETPGEFLPGLTFTDLIRIDGVAFNSEKVIDSIAVSCTVFEDLAASLVDEKDFDIRGFCVGARHRALGIIEEFCLAETVGNFYNDDRPLSLRPFHPETVGLLALREITGIDDFSKEEICSASDNILNNRSVQDIATQLAAIYLTEALPSVNGLCKNWEEALCHLKPYCPLPEPATESPVEEITTYSPFFYNYNFVPYIPSPEYVEKANAEFDEIVSGLASIAWLIAGYDGREETCSYVAGAIDPLSGRGDRAAAVNAIDRIFEIFYDVDRCSLVVDTALDLIREEDRPYILTGGNTNIVYQLTGYQSSRDFCQAVSNAFLGVGVVEPVTSSPPRPDGSDQPIVATFNIVANVVVHLQRVARSIL